MNNSLLKNYTDNDKNLAKIFIQSMNIYDERSVLEWKYNDFYHHLSGKELLRKVYKCSIALNNSGLIENDKAAIISENRWEWAAADFGCIMNKVVTVPLYTSMTPIQIKYILQHSETKLIFVSNQIQVDKLNTIFKEINRIKIIVFNDYNSDDTFQSFKDFMREDETVKISQNHIREYLYKKADKIRPEDLLTIIYTSGTTGVPKGVCLSHKNIVSNIISCHKAFEITERDIFMSYLPLAHSYERTAGYYFPLTASCKISYAISIDTISTQIKEIKPTVMTSVPVLFSRMLNKIIKTAYNMSRLRKILFLWGLNIADEYSFDHKNPKWKIADILVFKKIRGKLGGKIRFFISGGSALNAEVGRKFWGFGLKILEGYGMTEASPVIAVNREDNNKFGTVGFPLDNIKVTLAEDGEILVQGENVMTGYYKNEKDTQEVIKNGWLHTGDIGEFDVEGRLKITDRKKTLYKTSGGKYISLTHIEDTLSNSRYINQIIVTGGDRSFVTALIVPDFDELKELAETKKIEYKSNNDLINNEIIKKIINDDINIYQVKLEKHERVRRYKLLNRSFTIESGELTPTLKIKRKVIEEKHKDDINDMYDIKKI